MLPLEEWLTTRPDPSVQVVGFWAMLHRPDASMTTCVAMLDRVLFDKVEGFIWWSPEDWASYCANKLPDRSAYFESVLLRAEKSKDARPFVYHANLVKQFLSSDSSSASVWAGRILAIVDASKEFASHDGQSAGLITVLADYIPNLPKPVREVVNTADPWTNFVFQPIEMLGRDPEVHRQLVWTHFDRHAGDLVLVWLSGRSNVLVVTRMDIHGGKLRSCGEIDDLRWKWHGGFWGNFYIACSTDGPDHTFLGVYGCDPLELEKNWPVGVGFIGPWGCGLAMVGKGDVEVFRLSENGLQGDCNTMSWLGKYLYIGSDEALFRFDPRTKQFKTITSSKSLPGKNKLNGNPAYKIRSLVSDPTRDILWIYVWGDEREGIWKYIPTSDDSYLLPDSSVPDSRMFKSADKLVCGGDCGSRFRFINFDDKSTAATNICQYPPDSFNRMLKPKKGNPLVLVDSDIIDLNGNIIKADGTMGHFFDTPRWSAIESYKNGFIAVSTSDNPVQIWYVERKKQGSTAKR